MSQPTPYARQFDFTGWSTSRPNTPHPGVQIDAELNAVRAALNHALTNLALIQRDDTGLANGVVGIDQLSAIVQAILAGGGFTVRGNWAAATAYLRGDIVADDGKVYLVITDHNSSVSLAADIASGYVSSAIFEPHALLDYMDDLAAATGAGLVGSTGGITVQAALDLKAALASPTFTGTPAAPTAALGTDTTQIATTAFVQDAVQALLDAAPGTLDTLNELAAALGDDANFASTMTSALAAKVSLTALAADSGVFLVGNAVQYRNSRANLAAQTNTSLPAFLTESGREGEFIWSSSNLSAQVTSDPQQGIYVAPASDTTGASGAWVRKFFGPVMASWFGAVGNGTADDSVPLQAVLDMNMVACLMPGKYRTTTTLLVDPARNRNNGFVSFSAQSRYPYTQQTGGPAWDGTQEAVIFYDGSTSTTAAVIAASAEAVGTEPTSTFDNTVYGFTLRNVTLDANSKAGFGFYTARAQGLDIDKVKCRGATVAGGSVNGTYSGVINKLHCYLNPGRGFELGGEDDRSSWTTNDKVNALQIIGLHTEANGSDSTFRDNDANLKKANCGFYFGPHRGVTVFGVTSENNFGANIVFEPTSGGNSIHGVYTELGCKYAPGGAGTDAVSLGYATQQWGIMFIGAAAGTHCAVRDGVIATDHIWMTGTEPTAAREEGAFELHNLTLAGGVKSDWGNYRLVNCAVELETITGTSPVGAYTIKGGLQFGAGTDILSVYDEGTWTPEFAGITTAGTGWTYSVQAGEYTKIGQHVFFSGRVTLSAVSADATGQIAITGLPFTVKNANGANSSVQLSAAVNLATAVVQLDGNVTINNTRFTLQKRTAAATSASSVVLADIGATTSITFNGHYVAA